nr:5-dehydro-2-deoxygluconokinase [Jiangella mangrovi]
MTMGRVGVDIYPNQAGVGLEDVTTFTKYLGGSATNVAVAAARHGRRSAVVTRTGDDPLGRFVHKALKGYGVDDRFVTAVDGLATPVTLCEIFPPDDFPIYFYGRTPTAPDLQLTASQLDLDAVRGAGIFWVTVTGLCQEPSRSATLAALRARGKNGITVLDLDWRPMFWDSREAARPVVQEALAHVTHAVGNLDECETAVGTRDPRAAAAALRDDHGVAVAVVKQGPKGVLAVDDTGEHDVAPILVDVLNGLGAGDAFGGALCHGLLSGWPLARATRFANAAGAIVATRLACSDAMPTTGEVVTFLSTTEGADVR